MADSRIYDLAERTTPAAGDFLVLDANGETDALKFDATKPLLKSGGSGQAVTGTLYLDPALAVDANDAATVLKLPVLTDDGADFNFTIASVDFGGTKDTTFNWGFNNGAAGPADATKHAWYLQLEYDYFTGAHYAEYHLNFFGADSAFVFRPFEYKYNLNGLAGSLVQRSNATQFLDLTGAHTILSLTLGATAALSMAYTKAEFRVDVPTGKSNAFYILSQNGNVPMLQIDTVANDMTFRGRVWAFANAAGTNLMYKGTDDVFRFGGSAYNGGMVNILQKTNGRGIAINLAATTPNHFAQFMANDNTVIAYINTSGHYLFQTAGKVGSLAGNMEISAVGGHVILTSVKTTTGDPTGVEGLIYWNTFDNAIKMYADGAWRELATWA